MKEVEEKMFDYIKYNDEVYCYVEGDDCIELVTEQEKKTNESFFQKRDIWIKEINESDVNIQEIYNVDFYVDYIDEKQTMELMREVTRWCVNDDRPCFKQPEIEKDELGIQGPGMNDTDGWNIYDRGASSKIIHLSDCTGYIVKYTYIVKDGKKLEGKLVEEVNMTSEEFKEEMMKYKRI